VALAAPRASAPAFPCASGEGGSGIGHRGDRASVIGDAARFGIQRSRLAKDKKSRSLFGWRRVTVWSRDSRELSYCSPDALMAVAVFGPMEPPMASGF
jgi:hypothetical protein